MNANLTRPIGYKYFKLLSKEQQEEYLQFLVEAFGVLIREIAKMMKVSDKTLMSFINTRSITVKRGGNSKLRSENKDKWTSFCSGSDTRDNIDVYHELMVCHNVGETIESASVRNEEIPSENSSAEKQTADTCCVEACEAESKMYAVGEICFRGVTDWEDMFKVLRNIPISSSAHIKVEFD